MAQKILAYARKWVVDGIKPKRIKGEDGKPYLPLKFSFHELTQRRILKDDVALVDIAECEKLEKENYDIRLQAGGMQMEIDELKEVLKSVREQRDVEARRAARSQEEVCSLRAILGRRSADG